MKVRLALAALAAGLTVFACDDEDATAPANTALVFTADLSADSVVPPVDAEATGTGSFTVTTGTSTVFDPTSPERKIVTYSVSVGNLSGEAISAAIRGPADVSTTAAILVPLTVTSTDTTGLIVEARSRQRPIQQSPWTRCLLCFAREPCTSTFKRTLIPSARSGGRSGHSKP